MEEMLFPCRYHQQKQAEFFEPSLLHSTKSKLYRRIHLWSTGEEKAATKPLPIQYSVTGLT